MYEMVVGVDEVEVRLRRAMCGPVNGPVNTVVITVVLEDGYFDDPQPYYDTVKEIVGWINERGSENLRKQLEDGE